MKERVRHQLDFIVDDPDFIEMFDFIVTLGGRQNSYIPKLLRFLEVYIVEGTRTLRPSAFGVPNKLRKAFPRTKVALITRAYRKKPTNTICPAPEP